MKRCLCSALLSLVVMTCPASAVVAIYSGSLTTIYGRRTLTPNTPPTGVTAFNRVTAKFYLIFDNAGAYHLVRLYKDGLMKKIALEDGGTFNIMDVPGDVKGKVHQSILRQVSTASNIPAYGPGTVERRYVLLGTATSATAKAVGLAGGLLPPSYSFNRQIFYDYTFIFGGDVLTDEHSNSRLEGRLKLERALSKASNAVGDSSAKALTRVLTALQAQGYQ